MNASARKVMAYFATDARTAMACYAGDGISARRTFSFWRKTKR